MWIALLATAAAAIGAAIIFAWSGSDTQTGGARLNLGSEGQYGLVTQVGEGRLYLVRTEDESFIALSWVSPHRGCTVPWRENFAFQGSTGWFRDPCSASTFDREGHRVFGPAPRDMDRHPVTFEDGDIIVDTGTYVCGYAPPGASCVEPEPEPGR